MFERCSAHGALFLDEIGEVSIPVQIKLLQVLQERTFTPLGGREKKRFSGRVIAATNQPLDAAAHADGRFRDDFFYRLCSDVIEMPTLRQRLAESPAELAAAGAAAGRAHHRHAEGPSWSTAVLQSLEDTRAAAATRGRATCASWSRPCAASCSPAAMPRSRCRGARTRTTLLLEKVRAGELTAAELLARYSAMLHRRLGTYAEVAKRTGLDPRTTRKYVEGARSG